MLERTEKETGLAESDIFHILGNDRRRAIVSELAARPDTVEVSTIATAVATREADSEEDVPNNLYKSVYVSLQQTHLPQLESDEVISYDPDEKTIRHGPQFDHVRTYLSRTDHSGDRMVVLSLAVAITGLLTIVLSGIGVPIFDSVEPVVWGTLSLLIVSLGCLYQLFA
ncbi:DUF7344 domain-containing protein [Halovivax gelatinilyticus]|uniref:DUF7344 domain-containing protein n=1 Tax=Halovivax gelatinilyticus TaxID=2961597 RepID=UPI0020CA3A0D|nr:ArsR family transcriptional regulator [Halovivax gelatinilyticus]